MTTKPRELVDPAIPARQHPAGAAPGAAVLGANTAADRSAANIARWIAYLPQHCVGAIVGPAADADSEPHPGE
ncbi:MAG TPA: hypothetical protein VMV25_00600 [Steroidobacteraceae bacterium]|nr:hypothetical protein [Steroidobacteraceae bacterium]